MRADRFISAVLCLLMAGSVSVAATGCRETDVLKELINDQTSTNVDYNNPTKVYVNVPEAELTSENYAQMKETPDASIERERKSTIAVEGKSTVDDKVSKDEANEDQKGDKDKEEPEEKKPENSDKKGGAEGGDSADENSEGKGDTNKKGKGGKGTTVDLDGDNEPKQDAYNKVVAFGECANLVMMLAGEGALAGADKDFLENKFIQDVYKDDGIGDAATIRTTNGVKFNEKDVIKAKPEALFIMADTYTVSSSQLKKLKAADIDVVYLPNTTSHSKIKSLVTVVGKLFGNASQTPSGKDAMGIAESYTSYLSDTVKSVTKANGGLTTYAGLNYDTGKTDASKQATKDVAKINWTLYINDWDFDATYVASPNGKKIWEEQGVAVAKTGYTWSPLSYYMSVGGVNNNAAQFHVDPTHPTSLYYVWQFHLSYMPTSKGNFKNVSITTSKLANFADTDVLVRTQDGTANSYSLGCDNFRNVIVKNQKIRKAFEKARDTGTKKQTGLYAAYKHQDNHGQTGIGFFASQNMLVQSYIGYVDGIKGTLSTKTSTAYDRYENGENPYEIITNPHGLYSSWTDGSVESVLECQWIYDLYHNDGDFEETKKAVKDFYKEYYDYELSSDQVKKILEGLAE